MIEKNPFETIRQYYYTDDGDINWWIDEDELQSFRDEWSEEIASGSVRLEDERIIRGHEYNKWLNGNVWGDHEGYITLEKCPACGHLLIRPNENDSDTAGQVDAKSARYCSNYLEEDNECDYVNEEMKRLNEARERFWERSYETESKSAKLREPDLTLEQFMEKYNVRALTDKICLRCKQEVKASDYFIMSGYAVVEYMDGHAEDCENNGPAVLVPVSEKEKRSWNAILG